MSYDDPSQYDGRRDPISHVAGEERPELRARRAMRHHNQILASHRGRHQTFSLTPLLWRKLWLQRNPEQVVFSKEQVREAMEANHA